MASTAVFYSKSKLTIQYSNILSNIRPVSHNESLPLYLGNHRNLNSTASNGFGDFEPQVGQSTSTDVDEKYPADLVHQKLPSLLNQN
ncbi:hypothetical protein TNCT_58151 [Trichonephila clavata]|uniref:Uncharacterized protein n=1 Tax=Trichonephila clavata TaxID=2740835 RepID=A0A8X6LBP1_TRICU|nr:hypothetical protein TNCT_58151 [Trichonephila clavata]